MGTGKIKIGCFFLLLCSSDRLGSQVLYPGDVNNNGVVNGVDLLYLGWAFGATGPVRDGGNAMWEPQPLTTLWSQSFPDGLNYAYADCNGDGEVDDQDLKMALRKNFGETHPPVVSDYAGGAGSNGPILRMQPERTVVKPGDTLDIALVLGAEELPVSSFYGLSLVISFEPGMIKDLEDEDRTLDLTDSWVDPTGGDLSRSLVLKDHQNGKMEIALTRTDQQPVNGSFGPIGTFSIVVEDDIASGKPIDTLRMTIDSVRLLDNSLQGAAAVPLNTEILITDDPTLVGARNHVQAAEVRVFPNPARRQLYLDSEVPIVRADLFTLLGQPIGQGVMTFAENSHRQAVMDLGALPGGLYFLRIATPLGMVARTIVIEPEK